MNSETTAFTAFSLIAAPAVLTNACSVLASSTSNRLVEAVDQARQLVTELEQQTKSCSPLARDPSRELAATQQRLLMLIRAMRAFYTAVGGFASAALILLLGAVLIPLVSAWVDRLIEIVAVGIVTIAVGALVRGILLLVGETRVAVTVIEEYAVQVQMRFASLEKDAAEISDVDTRSNISLEVDRGQS